MAASVQVSRDTPVDFHRLTKYPLDDTEVFDDVDSLIEYCSSGAWYTGQHVYTRYDNSGVIIPYTIKTYNSVAYPIISMDQYIWSHVWYTYNSNHYLLVYYCNGSTFTNNSQFTILGNDADRMMMMDTIPIFKIGLSNYSFLMITRSGSSSSVTENTYTWSQANSPLITYSSGSPLGLISSPSTHYMYYSTKAVKLMPTTAQSLVVRLYVQANNYYHAMEDRY